MTPNPNPSPAALQPSHPPAQPARGWRSIWNELIVENPVLEEGAREQRKFFRSASGAGKIAPRIILGLAAFFYAWLLVQSFQAHEDSSAGVSYFELVLFMLVLTASIFRAVSGERERSTWEALILTRLTPWQIITGKLLWRIRLMTYIFALAALPIAISLSSTVEGATPASRVIMAQLLLLSWGLMLCSFGLWVSAMTQRSITSLAVIAVTLLVSLLAVPVLYAIFASAIRSGFMGGGSLNHDPIFWTLIAFNPFVALNSVLNNTGINDTAPDLGTSGLLQIFIYTAVAAIFIVCTYIRLRKLEEPRRISR